MCCKSAFLATKRASAVDLINSIWSSINLELTEVDKTSPSLSPATEPPGRSVLIKTLPEAEYTGLIYRRRVYAMLKAIPAHTNNHGNKYKYFCKNSKSIYAVKDSCSARLASLSCCLW